MNIYEYKYMCIYVYVYDSVFYTVDVDSDVGLQILVFVKQICLYKLIVIK